MKYIYKFGIVTLVMLAAFSCEDEEALPIVTFDAAGKGAYVRLVQETSRTVNIQTQADFDKFEYTYSVDFVDLTLGAAVDQYVLDLVYTSRKDPKKPVSTTKEGFRSFSGSDFSENEAGYLQLSDITFTAAEMATIAEVEQSDMVFGDDFTINGYLIMNDGSRRDGSNSSASVVGAAFRGHFDFVFSLVCPTDLEQKVMYSTVISATHPSGTDTLAANCAAGAITPITGTVKIVSTNGINYEFDDWSFGTYGTCYGQKAAKDEKGKAIMVDLVVDGNDALTFEERCQVVQFTGFSDSLFNVWKLESTLVGNTWTITWSNDSGEAGVTTLTFASAPSFTLAPPPPSGS